GFEGLPAHAAGEFPHLRSIRVGVHVSMGARQAVRAVGSALGMEAPRVNTVARQVPLLSSPGAIENVMMRAPELGIAYAVAGIEPYNTLVRVAGRLEGLPHRYKRPPLRLHVFVLRARGSRLAACALGKRRWSRTAAGFRRRAAPGCRRGERAQS